MEYLGTLQRPEPIVDAAIDIDHLAVAIEQLDGRQEARPLQAVLVELVRDDIRGCHQHHPTLEERFEQVGQDHRIGNVLDEELVEADHPRLGGKLAGDQGQGILFPLVMLSSLWTRCMKRWKWVRILSGKGSDS